MTPMSDYVHYVLLDKSLKQYHRMDGIEEKHRDMYEVAVIEHALQFGYEPCSACYHKRGDYIHG